MMADKITVHLDPVLTMWVDATIYDMTIHSSFWVVHCSLVTGQMQTCNKDVHVWG